MTKRHYYSFLILFPALFFVMPAAAIPTPDSDHNVLAKVNGEDITTDRLMAELERIHAGQQDAQRSDFDLNRLVNKLINDQLIVQDARLLELDREPVLLKQVAAYEQRAIVEQFAAETLPDTATVSAEEISSYYAEKYRQLHLYLLTVRDKEQAEIVAQKLKGGAKLSDLAAQFAEDLYRYGGGDLGFKAWISLEGSVRENAQNMQVGEVRGPFPHRQAYSLMELLQAKPADSTQLEPHRKKIKSLLKRQKQEILRLEYLEVLRKKYPVQVDSEMVAQAVLISDSTGGAPADSDLVLARVGQALITLKALKRKLMHSGSMGSPESLAHKRDPALQELIEEELLRQEAQAQNYSANPAVLEKVEAFQDSILLARYLEQVITPQIAISPVAVDSFYQANKAKYLSASQVKISQITAASDSLAREALNRLNSGADFAWIARKYSTDEYAVVGGERTWMSAEIFPQKIREELESAPVGKTIGPFESGDGPVLFKIVDRKPPEVRELSQVKHLVEKQLSQIEFTRILSEVLTNLKADADIIIYQETLDDLSIGAQKR